MEVVELKKRVVVAPYLTILPFLLNILPDILARYNEQMREVQ